MHQTKKDLVAAYPLAEHMTHVHSGHPITTRPFSISNNKQGVIGSVILLGIV